MKFAHELTEEDKAEYVELLSEGLDPGTAARELGSTGTAFRKLRSAKSQYYDATFAAACEEALDSTGARKARIDKLTEFVWTAAEKGEKWAIEKLLYAYHPDFEALRHQNLRITGQLDVVAKALPALSTAELERIREVLAADEDRQPAPLLALPSGE